MPTLVLAKYVRIINKKFSQLLTQPFAMDKDTSSRQTWHAECGIQLET